MRQLCPGVADTPESAALAVGIVQRRRTVNGGAVLHKVGDAFSTVYAIHIGAVKGSDFQSDGRERITAFYLPGELLGLDGFHTGAYTCQASALVDTTICELDLKRIEQLEDQQWEFVRVMSKVVADQKRRLMVGRLDPEERVQEVLRDICDRLSLDPGALQEERLPMSRADLASYAGVDVGTVGQVLGAVGDRRA